MQDVETVDIVVAGGGPAGLAATACFAAAGFTALCIDPQAPVTEAAAHGADIRTTAILQPGRDLLERAGLWQALAGEAAPLRVMQILDATVSPPVQRAFDSGDLGEAPFGWNLPNWLLRRAFLDRLEALPLARFRPGVGFDHMVPRSEAARVVLTDGSRIDAKLVVAADGRSSTVRAAAGIGVRTTRYGQKALAFTVRHPVPHDNISTEIHRSGGPFTLVPLPAAEDGTPRSAVVWMEEGPEALRLAELPVEAFEAAATDRSTGQWGPLTLEGRRSVWPIIAQIAHRFDGPRVALMAEAAHVVPPIGAQGLNMSLADVRALLELAEADPGALGTPAMLARYSRQRWPDVQARVAGIDMLNRTSMAGDRVRQALRRTGIGALHGLKPLRLMAMRLGLGAAGTD